MGNALLSSPLYADVNVRPFLRSHDVEGFQVEGSRIFTAATTLGISRLFFVQRAMCQTTAALLRGTNTDHDPVRAFVNRHQPQPSITTDGESIPHVSRSFPVLVKTFRLIEQQHVVDAAIARATAMSVATTWEAHPHLLPPLHAEFRKSAPPALIRHWTDGTVLDRLLGQPPLLPIERCWLVFQMICAVAELHSTGMYHGSISTSNFLVTGYNHVILADVGSWLKPFRFQEENAFAVVSGFFEGPEVQTRMSEPYLSPERIGDCNFLENGSKLSSQRNAVESYAHASDIFALGCCVAEVYADGKTVLGLPDTIRLARQAGSPRVGKTMEHENGQSVPLQLLHTIPDTAVRSLASHMCAFNPHERPTATDCLKLGQQLGLFPDTFYSYLLPVSSMLLHPLLQSPDLSLAFLLLSQPSFTSPASPSPPLLSHEQHPSGAAQHLLPVSPPVTQRLNSLLLYQTLLDSVNFLPPWLYTLTSGYEPPAAAGQPSPSPRDDVRPTHQETAGKEHEKHHDLSELPTIPQPQSGSTTNASTARTLGHKYLVATQKQRDDSPRASQQSSALKYLVPLMTAWKARREDELQHRSTALSLSATTTTTILPIITPHDGNIYAERLCDLWDTAFKDQASTLSSRTHVWRVGVGCRGVFFWPDLSVLKRVEQSSPLKGLFGLDASQKQSMTFSPETFPLTCYVTMLLAKIGAASGAELRVEGLITLRHLVPYMSQPVLTARILPFVLALLDEEATALRCESLCLLGFALSYVCWDTFRRTYITDCVLDPLRQFATSPEPVCRLAFGQSFPHIMKAAAQAFAFPASLAPLNGSTEVVSSAFYQFLLAMLPLPEPEVRIGLLRGSTSAASLLTDVQFLNGVLPHLISFMNAPELEVRVVFSLEAFRLLRAFTGLQPILTILSVLVPCYEGALNDAEELVVEAALLGLQDLFDQYLHPRLAIHSDVMRMKGRMIAGQLSHKIIPLAFHPNYAIAEAARRLCITMRETVFDNDPILAEAYFVPGVMTLSPSFQFMQDIDRLLYQTAPLSRQTMYTIALEHLTEMSGATAGISSVTSHLLRPFVKQAFKLSGLHGLLSLPSLACFRSTKSLRRQTVLPDPRDATISVADKAELKPTETLETSPETLAPSHIDDDLASRHSTAAVQPISGRQPNWSLHCRTELAVQWPPFALGTMSNPLILSVDDAIFGPPGLEETWIPKDWRASLLYFPSHLSLTHFTRLLRTTGSPDKFDVLRYPPLSSGSPRRYFSLSREAPSAGTASLARSTASWPTLEISMADMTDTPDGRFGQLPSRLDLVFPMLSSVSQGDAKLRTLTDNGLAIELRCRRSGSNPLTTRISGGNTLTWRMKGVICGTIHHHRMACLNDGCGSRVVLDLAMDQKLLVTGTLNVPGSPGSHHTTPSVSHFYIWDTASLERNLPKSCCRVMEFRDSFVPTAFRCIPRRPTILIGTRNGAVATYRMEVAKEPDAVFTSESFKASSGVTATVASPPVVANDPAVEAVIPLGTDFEEIACSIHRNGRISCWDFRCPSLSARFNVPVWAGQPSTVVASPDGRCIYVGTLGGCFISYDMRVRLPISEFRAMLRHTSVSILSSLTPGVTPSSVLLSLGTSRNDIVSVDPHSGLVEWNFLSRRTEQITPTEGSPVAKLPMIRFDSVQKQSLFAWEPTSVLEQCEFGGSGSVTCLWRPSTPGLSPLLAGSTDRRVRWFSLQDDIEDSYVILGGDERDVLSYTLVPTLHPTEPDTTSATTTSAAPPSPVVVLERIYNDAKPISLVTRTDIQGLGACKTPAALQRSRTMNTLTSAHHDAITSVVALSPSLSEESSSLLVTGSRDGLVKIWT